MLEQINQLFSSLDQLRSTEIDAHIEQLSQQLDQLRLLRQIVAIREESQVVGCRAAITTDAPVTAAQGPANGDNGQYGAFGETARQINDVPRIAIPPEGTHAWNVYQLLLKHKAMDFAELCNHVNISRSSLVNVLNRYVQLGLFEKVRRGRYRLRDENNGEISQMNKEEEIVADVVEIPAIVEKSENDLLPREGTTAWKIYQLLLERGEMTYGNIKLALGLNNFGNAMDKYIENGVFEKTGWGRYRIRKPPLENISTNFIKSNEKETSISLEGRPALIASYLQRNQPCKPIVIAADLKLSLSEVVLVLQGHSCFEMNGKGWVLKKGAVRCDLNAVC